MNNVISKTVQHCLCTSCGACIHICPNHNLEMKYSKKQLKWIPKVIDNKKCEQCNGEKNCLAVCPHYCVNYKNYFCDENHGLGKIEAIYTGYSNDPQTRFYSSSGGFVRTLCSQLINNKEVNGVIALTSKGGIDYSPKIYRTIEELDNMPNSIYHSVNYQKAIALLEKAEGRFVIIGLPCQLTSVDLYLNFKRNEKLRDKIFLKIGLICGYIRERKNIEAYAEMNKLELHTMEYRIGGRYRCFRINNKYIFDSKSCRNSKESILNDMFLKDKYTVSKSCLFCIDHLNFTADIAVGDAWLKQYREDTQGSNIIIVRNKFSDGMCRILNNYTLQEGKIDDIIESQGKWYCYSAGAFKILNLYQKRNYYCPQPVIDVTQVFEKEKIELFKLFVINPLLYKRKNRLAFFLYKKYEYIKRLIEKKVL